MPTERPRDEPPGQPKASIAPKPNPGLAGRLHRVVRRVQCTAAARREVYSRLSWSASQGGVVMPQIIVTAAVNDVEEWLKFKAEMVPAMSPVASDGAR